MHEPGSANVLNQDPPAYGSDSRSPDDSQNVQSKVITTSVAHKAGLAAWLACLGLTLIGCWPCYLIPFYLDVVLDVIHSCPACGVVIGTYPRL
ncbi:lipopolysaccharide-induced tumor necrosis factor-alpha factor homolog [Zophobas morio]|uniref:lipopolysaccharide-induced tumor necrosis factor-alpha factor homolog n=1 Tax=Zophobas morio TaxID=2755281 RepID=UPI003082B11A